MRKVWLSVLFGVGLVMVALGADPARHDRGSVGYNGYVPSGDRQGMIALSTVVEGQYQQLTVIDPVAEVMGVYHVDLGTGKIELRSVRNIHWDLRMTHYNSASPLPEEIQALHER